MRRGRRSTYQIDMRKAAQLAEAEEWSALSTLLNGYRPAAGEADLRNWEWHFLDSLARKKRLVDRQELVIQGPGAGIRQLVWSGGGDRLAIVGEDGEVVLRDCKTGKDLRRIGGGVRWVSFDRDGRRLTTSSQNGTVSLWPADPGPSRRFFGPVAGLYDFRQPAFSPDGRMVALAVDASSAAIHDAVTGLERHRLKGHQGLISVVAWDDTGQRLATGGSDGMIKVWDAATGRETASIEAGGNVFGLTWGAGGRQIAAVVWPRDGTRHVVIWDLALREPVFQADTPGGTFRPNQRQSAILLSPDGKRIATESAGRHHRLGQGHGPADLPGQGGLAVHPTGRLRPPGPSLGGARYGGQPGHLPGHRHGDDVRADPRRPRHPDESLPVGTRLDGRRPPPGRRPLQRQDPRLRRAGRPGRFASLQRGGRQLLRLERERTEVRLLDPGRPSPGVPCPRPRRPSASVRRCCCPRW